MSWRVLPTSRELRLRVLMIDTAVSIPVFGVMLWYIASLLEVSPQEWKAFSFAGLGYAALAAGGFEPIRRRVLVPLYAYLDACAQQRDHELSREAQQKAFASAISVPRTVTRIMLTIWVFAGLTLPLLDWLGGFPAWLSSERFMVVAAAGVTGGILSSAFMYFLTKRALAPIREALTAALPDPEERGALIVPMALSRKVQYVVAGTGFAAILFTMSLSYSRAGAALDELATAWQARTLAVMAPHVEAGDLGSARRRLGLADELLPYPTEFIVLDPDRADGDDASFQALLGLVEAGAKTGSYAGTGTRRVLAWQTLADDRVLVASVDRGKLREPLAGLQSVLAIVLVTVTGLLLGLGWLLAADISGPVLGLRREAERMALGDLRGGLSVESDDELGELGRSFERMGQSLRSTVGRVVEAADRVEATAGEIAGASESVAAASADQVRRIQQANELMLEISHQVNEVAGSAQALNVSVEESSSSILELGAAGDELNETASVLSSKVDEVSSSIDQMVQSVKQVATSSEELEDAAAETSSSMEEMASAMRVVDTTAEKTAELSSAVVASAENGQTKVRQTISGMEAIRDATDSAEQVIRGLGARTQEIGAILDVIDDVADETNLLALNAAIIAAQAGEQGRAFSVVAEEIKELADRVLASTKEIGGLIRSVQEEAANAEGAVEAGSASVASGVELSAEAGVSLEEITASSRESGTRIAEIGAAVREQTKAASHVVELMERVRHGVEQITAAGAEQHRGNEVVHRSSLVMREVAGQVRRTTEEQARGFVRIRESVEGVREAVEQINGSLQEQSNACSQVSEFLEQVSERTRSNEEASQRMGRAMHDLVRQAETLREDVAKFQI
ncbi:MAG: HAMP domain-containing methyl-accepting chemotaxis protein [Proteobacteria bacterium]|nr:HAMP domain-containing methyl-accepting chemotaxis protein [Pseudomonadota bacterium]